MAMAEFGGILWCLWQVELWWSSVSVDEIGLLGGEEEEATLRYLKIRSMAWRMKEQEQWILSETWSGSISFDFGKKFCWLFSFFIFTGLTVTPSPNTAAYPAHIYNEIREERREEGGDIRLLQNMEWNESWWVISAAARLIWNEKLGDDFTAAVIIVASALHAWSIKLEFYL